MKLWHLKYPGGSQFVATIVAGTGVVNARFPVRLIS